LSSGPAAGRPRSRILEATTSANEGPFTAGDWGLYLAISLIWGSSFLFIAVGLESIEPGLITWGRVLLGAVVLNVLPRSRVRIEPEDRRRLLVLSVVWVAVPFTLFPLAEQHINSAVTGMLNGAQPIFAAMVAGLLLKQPPGRVQGVGLLLGLAGVVLISLSQGSEGDTAWLGVAFVLLATLCYGFAVNIAPPIQQRYGALPVMARMLLLGSVWTAPFGLWGIGGSTWELGPVLALAFIGAVGTGVAFVVMGTLVGRVGATRASLITYLIPVVALGLGVAVQDDQVTAAALAGIVLVIAGALLASRQRPVPNPARALR
jgi:drug/metabolite transporter (DMT)-like permease